MLDDHHGLSVTADLGFEVVLEEAQGAEGVQLLLLGQAGVGIGGLGVASLEVELDKVHALPVPGVVASDAEVAQVGSGDGAGLHFFNNSSAWRLCFVLPKKTDKGFVVLLPEAFIDGKVEKPFGAIEPKVGFKIRKGQKTLARALALIVGRNTPCDDDPFGRLQAVHPVGRTFGPGVGPGEPVHGVDQAVVAFFRVR